MHLLVKLNDFGNHVGSAHILRGAAFNGDMIGCFGLNGPLRQYFSLYRTVSQREGERKEK